MGSSPRVRGKQCSHLEQAALPGLIPACAGKTMSRPRLKPTASAHPRVCGENSSTAILTTNPAGSSPRVRGKLARFRWCAVRGRLIPACAGKTRSGIDGGGQRGAHPRVCGENRSLGSATEISAGSSPRVRGKLRVEFVNDTLPRLIPACAGKTWD